MVDEQRIASTHADADHLVANKDVAGAIALLERNLSVHPHDFNGWMKLAILRRGRKDTDAALNAVHSALEIKPNDFLALLFKASLHEQRAEIFQAAEVYRAAVYLAPPADRLPVTVVSQLSRARDFLARERRNVESRLRASDPVDDPHAFKRTRFLDNILDRRTHYHQQPTHYRYPGLGDIEFFDHAYPAFLERLRKAFPSIRAEFLDLVNRHGDRQMPYVDFQPGQPVGQWAALNRSPAWNALHLQRYGETDPVNAAACPQTMSALMDDARADIPGLAPNLMFSLLRPKTHIPPHHGVANFRSVLHLPLIVPPGCRFRVGGDTRTWVEGEPFIFDDTIEHEAWNDGDSLRVVLIADLWRPELDAADRTIVRNVIAAQDGTGIVGAL